MKNIELIKNLQLDGPASPKDDVEFERLLDAPHRTIIEVRLSNGSALKRHHASVPITVLCLSGSGEFRAGNSLEDSQKLKAGTLITLEANVEHEVTAADELHLIVSKFKPD